MLASMLLLAATALADATPSAVTRVTFDLNSTAIDVTLPFDEEFILEGTAPEGVRSMELKRRGGNGAEWSREWNPKLPVKKGDKFQFWVPALAPDETQTFVLSWIRDLTADEKATFRTKAVATLDRQLRDGESLSEVTRNVQSAARFMEVLRASIPDREKVSKWPPALESPESFRQRLEQLSVAARIDDAVQNRQAIVTLFPSAAARLSKALQELGKSRGIQAIAASPDSTNSVDKGVLDYARWLLVGVRSDEIGAVADGRVRVGELNVTAPATTQGLAEVWSVDSLASRIGNLAWSEASLRKFENGVFVSPRLEKLRARGGWSKDDEADLRARLAAVNGEFRNVLGTLEQLRAAVAERNGVIVGLVEKFEVLDLSQLTLHGSTTGTFETRAKSRTSTDLGVLSCPNIDQVFPYFGVNFYWAPVNKRVPLRQHDGLGKRLALTVGLTATKVAGDRVSGVIGERAVLVGLGFRLTDIARLSGGYLVFRAGDRNPYVNQTHIRSSFYGAVSLDNDVRSILGKIVDTLF